MPERKFDKKKKKIQIKNKKKIENSRYIYQSELDIVCFQHDIAYEDFKDLPRRTTSDKALCDKAYKINC